MECHVMLWRSGWNLKPPEYLGIPMEEIDLDKLNSFYIASTLRYQEDVKRAQKKR